MEEEEQKKLIFIILLLFIIICVIITIFIIEKEDFTTKYNQINETYTNKTKEYTLLHNNKLLNLSKQRCINFELYIRFNESGVCFRPLNQMNDSKIQEIHNLCNQDLLVRCIND